MNQNYLLIGELADLLSVTTHTIRFYEKKGLLAPHKITDKGYRLYDFDTVSRLEEILLLRSLDMSVEFIQSYLQTKNTDTYKEQLLTLEQTAKKKIEALLHLQTQLKTSKELLTDFTLYQNQFYIRYFKQRQLLLLKKIANPFTEVFSVKDFYQCVKDLGISSCLVASKDLVFVSNNSATFLYLLIDPIDYEVVKGLDLFKLPASEYLCGFHTATSMPSYLLFLAKVERYLKKKNLKTSPYIVDISSSDYSIFSKSKNLSHFQVQLL